MIPALIIGREGSVGFPGKNLAPMLGRPLSYYPMAAAKHASLVDEVYLSTDSEKLKQVARDNEVKIIDRPDYLCTNEALGEDAFIHGYNLIKEMNKEKTVDVIVLLFCNAPTITSELIDKGINILMNDAEIDSVVTVSKYNWYSPIRARRINEEGLLDPFIPFERYDDIVKSISCDRGSQGDCYFADVALSVVRAGCLDNIENGSLPQKWMRKKIYPLHNWGGLDIDMEWQMPSAEYWLKSHGFTEGKTPYDKK